MRQNPFGLHRMDNEVDDAGYWSYLDRARPASVVVLNNAAKALETKARYPEMIVVHRQYHRDDAQWFLKITPEQWINDNRGWANTGVYVQCLNEPGGDFRNDHAYREKFITWLVEVIRLAKEIGLLLALPNFAVGNPHESRIIDGSFDRLIRACAGNDMVIFSNHEYWHTDPISEYPYTIGRHEFWVERCQELGLPPLNILLTEHGMDKGGGGGDGWREQGISGRKYGEQFIASRTKLLYKPPTAIYGFGNGFGWNSFNIAGDTDLLNILMNYTEDVPVNNIPNPTTDGVNGKLTKVPKDFINIREQPNDKARDLGDLRVGDEGVYYPNDTRNGWVYFARKDGLAGWVSLQNGNVVFSPITEPNPPDEDDTVELLINELTRIRESVDQAMEIAATLRKDGFRLSVPVVSPNITQRFGENPERYKPYGFDGHEGIDYGGSSGEIIYAAASGKVTEVFKDNGAHPYGNHLRIEHRLNGDTFETVYAHLSGFYPGIEVGDYVVRGEEIGFMGTTGRSTGNHLHLTLKRNGIPVDPEDYL